MDIKLLLSLTLIGFLSSCCTKKDCGTFHPNIIYMENFLSEDIDSIVVERFRPYSNYTERVDSLFIFIDNNYNVLNIPYDGSHWYDYRITLISYGVNEIYELKDFVTEKKSCNKCPIRGEEDKYLTLKSYTVNGKQVNWGSLKITKQ